MATWPSTLPVPLLSGYQLEAGDPTARTSMESGPARVRRRFTAVPDEISLVLHLTRAQMTTFRAFWDTDWCQGAAWVFFPVLDGRSDVLEDIECRPTQAKFSTSRPNQNYWRVQITVEMRRGEVMFWEAINALQLPSLELDFAGTKSLSPVIRSLAQPTPAVTFTRASTATYVGADGLMQTAAINEPRFDHDSITRACKGLLIEEARTNLCVNSEDFSAATWAKYNVTVTPNVVSAPDGVVSADKLLATTTNALHYVYRPQSVTSGQTYVASFFVKSAELERCRIQFFGTNGAFNPGVVDFNVTAGAVTGTPSASLSGYGIDLFADGWRRVWAASTAAATASGNVTLTLINNAGVESFAGDGTSGLYVWGAQLEAGTFPTSYIPTAAAAVPRVADLAQMTGANFSSWYRQDEGAFSVSVNYTSITSYSTAFSADRGTTTDAIRILGMNNGTDLSVVSLAGEFQLYAPRANTRGVSRYALAYKRDDFASLKNGSDLFMDTSGTPPSPTGLRLGTTGGTGFWLNGHIARLTYYPTRLTNARLQELSNA